MSQHVMDTCNESEGLWLPLTEYAVKSGVSLSTIRRKIKSNTIAYRLEKGRYLILFSEPGNSGTRPAPVLVPTPVSAPEIERRIAEEETISRPLAAKFKTSEESATTESERWILPLIDRSVRMVSEAFEKTLKEKDERIRLLEKRNAELDERLNELRTLVHVLEEKYGVRY